MIKTFCRILLAVALVLPASAFAQGPQRNCDVGPLTRTYGGTRWLVYSCDDRQTLVFVSAPGSPAMPFVFILFPEHGKRRLYGEGTGQKKFTEAAMKELSGIDSDAVAALIEASQKVKAARQPASPVQ